MALHSTVVLLKVINVTQGVKLTDFTFYCSSIKGGLFEAEQAESINLYILL